MQVFELVYTSYTCTLEKKFAISPNVFRLIAVFREETPFINPACPDIHTLYPLVVVVIKFSFVTALIYSYYLAFSRFMISVILFSSLERQTFLCVFVRNKPRFVRRPSGTRLLRKEFLIQ